MPGDLDTYRTAPVALPLGRPRVSVLHRLAHWLGINGTRLLSVETLRHNGCGGQVVMILECAACGQITTHQVRICRPCAAQALHVWSTRDAD